MKELNMLIIFYGIISALVCAADDVKFEPSLVSKMESKLTSEKVSDQLQLKFNLREAVQKKDLLKSTKNQQLMGGNSGGGGNTYRGRPLESFIRDPKNYMPSVYAKWDLLRKKMNPINWESNMGRAFSWVMKKTWYFVPGPLEPLSKDQIGAFVSTEQGAMQDFDSVWIDSEILNNMNEEDQFELFVHESLMAIKLLRFESMKKQCMASWFDTSPCLNFPDQKRGSANLLTANDYNQVRELVVYLLSISENESSPELSRNVNNAFSKGDFSFDWGGNFFDTSLNRELTQDDLKQIFQEPFYTKVLPNHLFRMNWLYENVPGYGEDPSVWSTAFDWLPDGRCEILKMSFENKILTMQINIQPTLGEAYTLDLKSEIANFSRDEKGREKLILIPQKSYGRIGYSMYFYQDILVQSPQGPTIGDESRAGTIYLNQSLELEGISIHDRIITKIVRDENGKIKNVSSVSRMNEKFDPICSLRKKLTVNKPY